MKNIFLLLLLFTGIVNGQIVNIPDANFKALLLSANDSNEICNHFWLDANSDGEIDTVEAGFITRMQFSGAIADFTGLEAFVNLTDLIIYGSDATEFNIPGLNNLVTLTFINNSQITSIDLNQFPNLQRLDLDNLAAISDINFTTLTNLTYLNISNCPITDLDVSFLPNLDALQCVNNDLTAINFGTIQNLTSIDCQANNIVNLNLANFINLENLACGYNPISSLDLTNNNNLINLSIRGSNFSNINLANLANLESFLCDENSISSLDLTSQNNLKSLYITNNLITNIEVSNLTLLENFYCGSNPITSLNANNLPLLLRLEIKNTPITNIDLSNNPLLQFLDIADTNLPSLNLSSLTQLQSLTCSNTPYTQINLSPLTNLISLKCGGNALTELRIKNGQSEFLTLTTSPNLIFICADDAQMANVQQLASLNATSATVSPYCTFIPGGNFNTVTGNVIFDENNNGCDSNDTTYPFNVRLSLSNGSTESATFLNATDVYSLYAQLGNYTLSAELEHPDYFVISPQSAPINFANFNNTQTQNFCITPNGFHPDLEIVMTPIMGARPGFDAYYKIVYKNKGNQLLDGIVNLIFDDVRTDYVSAIPAVDNQQVGSLTWNFSNLHPFETRVIDLVLNLNTPLENPPLNSGDILYFTANTSSAIGEGTLLDNTFQLNQTVVNSMDPNDKSCLEGNVITPEDIGKYVHYNINFENVGTADAINVVIKDIIDTTMFDMNSLQLLYASHPVETKIGGNKVEFIFENINLPPSNINPIGGHGNVLFKIKTLPTLLIGDQIANTANIYFDYNAPIETNEARSTFAVLNNSNFVQDASITVAPNPATNSVTVTSTGNIKSIELFDAQGRILQNILENKNTATIDISNQSNGIYFLKVTTEIGSSIQKLIKE